MPTKENKILKQANRSAVLDASVNVDERKVSLCFMTEKACDNWWVPEVCLCNRENADLTRFDNGIAPVLFNHDRDVIIGKIAKIDFSNQRACAEIVFDKDEKSEAIFQKVQSGSLRGVSVGYIRQNTTRIEADEKHPIEFMGRTYNALTDVTTKWELLEISIVSVPADNDTGVGRDLNEDNSINVETLLPKEKNNAKEKSKMGEEKQTPVVNVEKERQEAIAVERERTQSIMDMCRKFGIDAEKQNKYIADGISVENARALIMDVLAERQKPANVVGVEFGKDENEKFRSAVAMGLAVKYGVANRDSEEAKGTHKYANMSLRGLAEECLEREGERNIRYKDVDYVWERALGSGAFLGIVDDFANKVKLSAYAEQPFIWKNFVSVGQNKDFKANYKYEMGLDGLPTEMAHESAEFKYQEIGDTRIQTKISTFGKAIRLTREIFINDDLGQVKDAIAIQTGGFARLKEIKFFETLLQVPFNSAHKNIATSTGITAAVYDELTQAMMTQKDINGEGYVGVAPAFILAPTNQRMAHKILLNSGSKTDQNNPGVINPVQGDFQLFVTPYLTGNYYYAIARPGQMRGIEYTTLGGNDGVQSRTVVPNAYLGIEYQMWNDFGFNVLDHRAFARASKQ